MPPTGCAQVAPRASWSTDSPRHGSRSAVPSRGRLPLCVRDMWRQNRIAIAPPSEKPMIAARFDPAASITARTSSIRVSRSGRPETRSDSPVPRLSKSSNRQKEAMALKKSAGVPSQATSRFDSGQPLTKTTSNGPLPIMAYAMLVSPLFAYRTSGGCTAVVSSRRQVRRKAAACLVECGGSTSRLALIMPKLSELTPAQRPSFRTIASIARMHVVR